MIPVNRYYERGSLFDPGLRDIGKRAAIEAAALGALSTRSHSTLYAYKKTEAKTIEEECTNPVIFFSSALMLHSSYLENFPSLYWRKLDEASQKLWTSTVVSMRNNFQCKFFTYAFKSKILSLIEGTVTPEIWMKTSLRLHERLQSFGPYVSPQELNSLSVEFPYIKDYCLKALQDVPYIIFYQDLTEALKDTSLLQDMQEDVQRHIDGKIGETIVYKTGDELRRELLGYDLAKILKCERVLLPKLPVHLDFTILKGVAKNFTQGKLGAFCSFVRGTDAVLNFANALLHSKDKEAVNKAFFDSATLESYQELCFLLLVLGDMDAHRDQFAVDKVFLDLDMSRIAPPGLAVKRLDGTHLPILRCALLDLPHFKHPLNEAIKKKILSLDPAQVQKEMDAKVHAPCLSRKTSELLKMLKDYLKEIDRVTDVSVLKYGWNQSFPQVKVKGTLQEHHAGTVALSAIQTTDELRPLMKVRLSSRIRKLESRQEGFSYLSFDARNGILGRLERAHGHLKSHRNPTTETLFEAIYPEIYPFFKVLQKIEAFPAQEMGNTQKPYTAEMIFQLTEKLITPEERESLKKAYKELCKYAFEPSILSKFTAISIRV